MNVPHKTKNALQLPHSITLEMNVLLLYQNANMLFI
jgi:hypothetical protein